MTTNLSKSITEVLKELKDNGELTQVVLNAFKDIENKITFISVENFGAVGDGVVDDTNAFVNAINFCNENGVKLVCHNKTYKVTEPNITVNCDVDFNGATIILTGSDGRFLYVCDESETYELTHESFTKTGVNDERLYGKAFMVQSPLSLGQRYGNGEEWFYVSMFACDDNGNFINKFYEPNIIEGSYRFRNAKPLSQKPITIENVNIKFECLGEQLEQFAYVNRNNVTFKNVCVNGNIENTVVNHGIVELNNCFNCHIENFNCKSPFNNNMTGYIVNIYCCDNVTVKNCNMFEKIGGSWGSIACQFSDNIYYENCTMERLDCHFFGTYTAKNCVVDYANFSGGYGNVIFDNCIILGLENGHSISFRNDYPYLLSGSIIIKNCKINTPDGQMAFRISENMQLPENYIDFNFEKLQVIIENTVMNGGHSNIYIENVNSFYRNKIDLQIKNSSLKTNNHGVWLPRGSIDYSIHFKSVLLDHVYFESSESASLLNIGYADRVRITNCDMSNDILKLDCKTAHVFIDNNIFSGLNIVDSCWFLCVTNNDVTKDEPPVIGVTTQHIVKNNIISANTRNTLTNWNE